MPLEIRAPDASEIEELFHADGRGFGVHFSDEEIKERAPTIDVSRFRVAVEKGKFVGIAGSFEMDLTMPGGATVPSTAVTWVSSQPTHRRQGIMTKVLEAVHEDGIERGEPVAILSASESAIYGRFGYGVASYLRIGAISKGQAQLKPGTPDGGDVWFADTPEEARKHVVPMYDAYRVEQPGELSRNSAWWDVLFAQRGKERGAASPAFYLLHDEGYASYRVEAKWNFGHPGHTLDVLDFVALTPEARGALWRTIFGVDLVAEYTMWCASLDDPLVHWLVHPRALRTTMLNDWLWVKPQDHAALLRSRTYGSEDKLVVQVGERRLSVDAAADGVAVRTVRTRPDITTDDAGFGAIIMGGVTPSRLARAGRLEGANHRALRRADALFLGDVLPYSQTPF